MTSLSEMLDTLVQYVAPFRKWRVVETVGHPDERKLHGIIGDFDNLHAAFEKLDEVRFPYTRTIFNDTGMWVAGITPGALGQPDSGPES